MNSEHCNYYYISTQSSRFTIYGQKVYLGILYHGLFHRNIHKLFTGTIFYYMDAYYFLKMKPYTTSSGYNIYWTLLRRCRYYSMELLFSTCCIGLQVMSTRQFLRQMSPSPMFVNTKGHATHQSTYLIMLVPFV